MKPFSITSLSKLHSLFGLLPLSYSISFTFNFAIQSRHNFFRDFSAAAHCSSSVPKFLTHTISSNDSEYHTVSIFSSSFLSLYTNSATNSAYYSYRTFSPRMNILLSLFTTPFSRTNFPLTTMAKPFGDIYGIRLVRKSRSGQTLRAALGGLPQVRIWPYAGLFPSLSRLLAHKLHLYGTGGIC